MKKIKEENQNKDLNNDEREGYVEQLKILMSGNSVLKNVPSDENYLLRFLYSTSFDVISAFELMKSYYAFMMESPQWFTKDGPLSKKNLIEKNIRIVIPHNDRDGRPIYLFKAGNLEPGKMELTDIVSIDDCWVEYVAEDINFKEKGLCVIVDIANVTWRMLKWCTPYLIRTYLRKITTWPVKEYKVHVVNSNIVASSLIKIVWPFVMERLKKMVYFHFDDWESLHEHINPNELPPEYRGSAVIDYEEIYKKLFRKNNEILDNFKTFRTL